MREVRRKAQLAARRSLVVLLARSEAIRRNRRCKEGLAHASVTDLVSTYAQAAAVHGRASSEGDYDTANIQHDLIAAVYRQLRERGGWAALVTALSEGLCENDCTDYGALPLILLAACIAGLVAALFVGRRAWRTYCHEVSPENYPTFRTAAMGRRGCSRRRPGDSGTSAGGSEQVTAASARPTTAVREKR